MTEPEGLQYEMPDRESVGQSYPYTLIDCVRMDARQEGEIARDHMPLNMDVCSKIPEPTVLGIELVTEDQTEGGAAFHGWRSWSGAHSMMARWIAR